MTLPTTLPTMTFQTTHLPRTVAPAIATVLALLLFPAGPAYAGSSSEAVAKSERALSAAGVSTLSVEAQVGEFTFKGETRSDVQVRLTVRCERPVKAACRDAARRITLGSSTRGETLAVKVEGWPKRRDDGLHLELDVSLPRDLALEADLGVGEVEVSGIDGGLSIDLGVGEVSVEAAESTVRRVSLEVGVGEASLRVGGRVVEGKGFLGSDLEWKQGTGRAAVRIDCGVGEVDVRLE